MSEQNNLADLIVLNSNLTVAITLQNWPVDTLGPFADTLIKKGFTVNRPTSIQQMQVQSGPFASKNTTTGLGIDYGSRRVVLQITNNITNPQENVKEVFAVLTSIGYPPQESINRIDIQGAVTIKTQAAKASTFVPNVVSSDFIKRGGEVFNREIRAVGIRLTSAESISEGVGKSPFVILMEPLFNDPTDTKILVQLNYASASGDEALDFLEHLYDRLKKIILELKK